MARARAVYATGYFDDVAVDNQGDIAAYARADGGMRAESHGIYAFGYGSANDIDNGGDIQAASRADGGAAYATGITSIGYGAGDHVSTVANDGTIATIAENTVPFSETPVLSREPVAAVLELVGGRTAELGIAEGDRVSWAK